MGWKMHILRKMIQEWDKGLSNVLLTIIETMGSTYRKSGAQILVNNKNQSDGQLSGGCIEQDLIEQSQALLSEPIHYRLTQYLNLSDPGFFDQSGCIGDLHVLLVKTNWLKKFRNEIEESLTLGHEIKTLIVLECRDNPLLEGQQILFTNGQCISMLEEGLKWDLETIQRVKKSSIFQIKPGTKVYIHVFDQEKKLVIFGAGNDVIPLVKIASILGFHTFIIDFREGLLVPDKFPHSTCIHCERNPKSISQTLASFKKSNPVIMMSHNLEYDGYALDSAVKLDFDYIGLLGSTQRLSRIEEHLGKTINKKNNIRNPIGIRISADTSEEIAISILGEVISFINQQGGGRNSDCI